MADEAEGFENRKRAASEDDDMPQFKRRYGEGGGYYYDVRFLVQSQEAGTIIGRGGDNIKRLRQDFKANVQVSDNRGPERIASFGGESPVLGDLIEDVLRMFLDKQQNAARGSRRNDVELRMLIHQSQAGCVIGKAGNKLREMRQDYGVEVKVYATCCPMSTDRIVRVSGMPEKVTKCIVYIFEMLRTWPPKGYNNPYDPVNFDPEIFREYGGFLEDGDYASSGPGDWGERRAGGDMYGAGPSRGQMPDYSRMPPGQMDGAGMSLSTGYPMASVARGPGGPGEVTSQQVSIPADLAGVIIGKAGQRIKQVRTDSGADIELSDAEGVANIRIITITGTQQQIHAAQYMLQTAVKQYLAGSQ